MEIPKYVVELMQRSKYNFDSFGNNYAAGYTIDIAKYSCYESADTFRTEIDRLQKWVERQTGGKIIIINRPILTRYAQMQYATVTIYDPVMKHIEKFIPQKGGKYGTENVC